VTEVVAPFDLYVWKSPRDLDETRAHAIVGDWLKAGADPASAPFEASDDVAWFYRELMEERPRLDAVCDAVYTPGRVPVWLSQDDPPPAHVVALRLSPETSRESIDSIFGLATKYDLVLFDAVNHRVHQPLAEMAAYASATFWPRGAIRAAVAGGAGGILAVLAWIASVPLLSGVVVLAGGFMFLMAIITFVHEARVPWRGRRSREEDPTSRSPR
jgi:hypothetical protein